MIERQPAAKRGARRCRASLLALGGMLIAGAALADGVSVDPVNPLMPAQPVRGRDVHALRAPAAPVHAAPVVVLGLDAPMTADLRQVNVATALRMISEVAGVNIVATQAVADREVTLYMASSTAGAVLDSVTRATGLWYRWRPQSNAYLVTSAEEFQRDIIVFGEERTQVFRLRHHNVVSAAGALRALFGNRVLLQSPTEESLGESMKTTDLRRASTNGNNNGNNGNGFGQNGNNSGNNNGNNFNGNNGQNNVNGFGGGFGSSQGFGNGSAFIERRGGTRNNLQGGDDQIAAAAAAAGSSNSAQFEAARSGQEAPMFVTYNKLHNLLIVRTGDDKAMAQAQALIEQIDLPARQVLLEMRIIQVRLDDEFHRAFDFDMLSYTPASGPAAVGTAQPVNPLTGAAVGPRAVASLGNYDLFDKNTGLFQFIDKRIRLRLQLLEEKGRVETLARPLLLASNNEAARLFIGEEVVLVTGASAQTTTGTTGAVNTVITADTEKRNIGTTLVIHPRINEDRTVTLTIDEENSERVAGGTTIPLATGRNGDGVLQFPIDTVNTSVVQAVAQAKDGLTIAVGGMIKLSRNKVLGNVPGLSSVPFLGELFKSEQKKDERFELVLVITPHVLENAEEAQATTQRLRDAAAVMEPPAGAPADSSR